MVARGMLDRLETVSCGLKVACIWAETACLMGSSQRVCESAVKKHPFAPKLSEEEKVEVCRWIGTFHSPSWICAKIHQEFGKSLRYQSVLEYFSSSKWAPLVGRFRQEYISQIMEVPIYHKKVRLERLQALLDKVEEELEGVQRVVGRRRKRKEILVILRSAREEVEKYRSPQGREAGISIQYQSMSDEELSARKKEILERLKRTGGNTNDTC